MKSQKKKRTKKGSSASASSKSMSISTKQLKSIINKLEMSRFRDTTRQNYVTVWRCFNKFIIRLDVKPTTLEDRLILFVGHLISENKQSQTIRSYISAIKAVLKENRIILKEDEYLLSSLTRACKIKNDVATIRLSIHKDLLAVLLQGISRKFTGKEAKTQQPYLCSMYKTLFLTTYYGMFRVGEVTKSQHSIKAKDVFIGENKKKFLQRHTAEQTNHRW